MSGEMNGEKQESRIAPSRATTLPPMLFPVTGRNREGLTAHFTDPPELSDEFNTSTEDVTLRGGVGYTSMSPREGWGLNKARKKKIQCKSVRRKNDLRSSQDSSSPNNTPLRSKAKQQRPREHFYSLLRHSATANDFKLTIPAQDRAMVDLWRDLDYLLRSASAVDTVVGQSMIQELFVKQRNQSLLPSAYRRRFKVDYGDLEISEQVDIVESIHQEVFGWLLLRHAGSTNKRKTLVKRKLTKSMHFDPFEDPNSNLVRYFASGDNKENDLSQLMAATTEKIIYFLTKNDTELHLRWTYIFTCSYYTKSPSEFLSLLIDRFHLVMLKPQNTDVSKAEIQISLVRIVDVLKMWMNTYVSRVRKSKKIQHLIRDFAENTTKSVSSAATTGLLNYLNSMVDGDEGVCQPSLLLATQTPPKIKKLPKHIKSMQDILLEDIHPLEAARQIALIDHSLYRAIMPDEVLHLNWTRSQKHQLAPNVLRMIKQFNSVGEWVITQIVTTTKASYRVKHLARLIEIAYESYRIGNLNGAMAFVSGLNSNKVTRLRAAWNDLPSSSWDQWEELVPIFKLDDNFSALREKTASTASPVIPYLGMYLSSLTFKEGESNYTDDGLINVAKLMYVGNVILQIQKGQQTPFNYYELPLLQEFFMKLPTLSEEEYAEQRASRRSKRKSILVRGGSVPSLAGLKSFRKSTKYPSDLKIEGNVTEEEGEYLESAPRSHSVATVVHSPRGHSSPPEKKKEGSKSRRKRFFKGIRPPSALRKRESSTPTLADMKVAL